MYIESLSIATLEQAIHLREEVFPGVSNSSDSPLSNNIQEYCKLVAIPRYMKSFICYVTLLLFGASLLANSRSTANESSITSNSLVVAETTSSEEFIARGTEPFWSVTVSKKGIVYSSPDTKQQTFSYVAPLKAEARRADLVRVYRLQGKGNNILIIKKVDACSDGMSDKEYPYSAIFILGNKVLEGCAEKK